MFAIGLLSFSTAAPALVSGLLDGVLIVLIATLVIWFFFWFFDINGLIRRSVNKRLTLTAKFFKKHLGNNEYYSSRSFTRWRLHNELKDIQARVPLAMFLKIQMDIRQKVLSISKRRALHLKLYNRMTADQQKKGDEAISKAKLNLACEIVELAELHTKVTDAQMKFITGDNTAREWFSADLQRECQQLMNSGSINPVPKQGGLVLRNGPNVAAKDEWA